jgi:hypothetical protein
MSEELARVPCQPLARQSSSPASTTTPWGHPPTACSSARTQWKRVRNGYVREKTDIEDIETIDGVEYRNSSTIRFLYTRVK